MQLLHLRAGGFVFPTLSEIQAAQRKHAGLAPPSTQRDTEGTLIVAERVWVPEAEVVLLQRILIAAHCGSQGHCGIERMMTTVTEFFEVANLAQVWRRFLSRCLLCRHVKRGNIIPRPGGPTYDAKERHELLHVDYLYMEASMRTCQYVLVLKHGLTHIGELIACDSPTCAVAASVMLD
ncbi:hypothetical protein PHMEG_00010435 [Phytophthora megakarya]|uniref:Integrase zinc-binding domain-containing protein n=1 Tax=Phytophthora megakarya TaxID=4795 RepID=A0A225WDR0_9STRA|nr:hypothetical protein PHMEG_00010435 [Phytophthora megakarya]